MSRKRVGESASENRTVEAAVDVLCEAFADYPVMRYVIRAEGDEYRRRLETLIRFFVTARVLRDEPILTIPEKGGAAACAIVTLPGNRPSPPALGEHRQRVWADLGPQARARYEAFGAAYASLAIEEPHHHLNMIGVRADRRGEGLGGRLMDAVHRLAREDPGSAGVTLTTEDPANLPFYRHFGYRCLGSVRIDEGLESWTLFRPRETG